jgi:hypothetical protein
MGQGDPGRQHQAGIVRSSARRYSITSRSANGGRPMIEMRAWRCYTRRASVRKIVRVCLAVLPAFLVGRGLGPGSRHKVKMSRLGCHGVLHARAQLHTKGRAAFVAPPL